MIAAGIQAHRFHLTSSDGLRIACARWDSGGPVRDIIQIAHGLGEHVGRYLGLVERLVKTNLVVYAGDHRGHGLTALPTKNFGDFGPGGFDLIVEDMARASLLRWTDRVLSGKQQAN